MRECTFCMSKNNWKCCFTVIDHNLLKPCRLVRLVDRDQRNGVILAAISAWLHCICFFVLCSLCRYIESYI